MDNQVKMWRYYGAIKVLLSASNVFQFVGYVTPGWLYLVLPNDVPVEVDGEPKRTLMLSLWYVVACADENASCDVFSFSVNDDVMQYYKRELVWPKVKTTLALVTCLMALIGVWKTTAAHITSESRRIRAYITMMASILSCYLSITTVTFVARWSTGEFFQNDDLNPISFPFSLILTGLGGIMAGGAFTINIVWRPWKVVRLYSNAERVPAVNNPGFTTNQSVGSITPVSGGNEKGQVVQHGLGYSVYSTQQTGNVYPVTNEHIGAITDPYDSIQVQGHEQPTVYAPCLQQSDEATVKSETKTAYQRL